MPKKAAAKPKLLSGGNPQIPKGDGDGWFLSYHCFDRYIKVTFFRGTSLDPVPPEGSKIPETRYFHIYEDGFDEKQFAAWVKQASKLPGEHL